jgi:O-antigen ligase/Flp pilus assembly protein TadD
MDREHLDNWCEWGIFGLVLAILLYAPFATGAVLDQDLLVLQILSCGILGLWIIRFWTAARCRLWWPPICWAALAFTAYAVGRYLFSDVEFIARRQLLRVAVYAIVFFAILNHVNRQERCLVLCLAMVFFAGLDSIYAIYQFATHSNRVLNYVQDSSYAGRSSGTYINPNHLAGFLAMAASLAMAFIVAGRLSHAFRIVLAYVFGLIVIAVGLTLSRGGYAATAVPLVILLAVLVARRNYRVAAGFFLGLLLWGGYYFATHNKGLEQRMARTYASGRFWDARADLWRSAWSMWQSSPWIGVGPAHYDVRFEQFRPDAVQERPDWAHNDYLNTMAEWGLAGAFLVAAAIGLFYWGVVKTLPFVNRASNDLEIKRSNKPAVVLGGAAAVLAALVHSTVDFDMQIPANALFAIAMLAVVSGYLRFATERHWAKPRLAGKLAGTAALAAALWLMAGQVATRGKALRWSTRAEDAQAEAEAKAAALAKALQAEPANNDFCRKLSEDITRLETERARLLRQALAADPMDEELCLQLADLVRFQSSRFEPGWQKLAREAMSYYEYGAAINPWDAYNHTGYGKCLDWLGQPRRATPYFKRALELGPNDSQTLAAMGWHEMELGDFRGAARWYGRALIYKNKWHNPEAWNLYHLALRRAAEADAAAPKRK